LQFKIIIFFSVFYHNYANKQNRIKDGYKIKTMHPLFSFIVYMLTNIHVENFIHCSGKIEVFMTKRKYKFKGRVYAEWNREGGEEELIIILFGQTHRFILITSTCLRSEL